MRVLRLVMKLKFKSLTDGDYSFMKTTAFLSLNGMEKTKVVLDNQKFRRQMVEHNYALGLEYFSYGVLHRGLRALLVQRGWIR